MTTGGVVRRRGVSIANGIMSGLKRPVVNTGIIMRNRAMNAVASVSKIFGLSIPGKTGLLVSFVKCDSGAMRMGRSGVRVILSSSSRVLKRMRIMTCNIRGGISIAKTVSDMGNRRLAGAPANSVSGVLSKRVTNLAAMRCSNRPKDSTTGVFIHNRTA